MTTTINGPYFSHFPVGTYRAQNDIKLEAQRSRRKVDTEIRNLFEKSKDFMIYGLAFTVYGSLSLIITPFIVSSALVIYSGLVVTGVFAMYKSSVYSIEAKERKDNIIADAITTTRRNSNWEHLRSFLHFEERFTVFKYNTRRSTVYFSDPESILKLSSLSRSLSRNEISSLFTDREKRRYVFRDFFSSELESSPPTRLIGRLRAVGTDVLQRVRNLRERVTSVFNRVVNDIRQRYAAIPRVAPPIIPVHHPVHHHPFRRVYPTARPRPVAPAVRPHVHASTPAMRLPVRTASPTQFISDDTNCPISQETIRTPAIINCGHRFEKEMIEGWYNSKFAETAYRAPSRRITPPCPVCRAAITSFITPPQAN
jgi:hypothetical protein